MRYLCVHCDKSFEHDDDTKKARCPACMRVNGVEPVQTSTQTRVAKRAPWLWWAVAGGAFAVAGVGYAWWASQAADVVEGEAPLAPLGRSAVLGHLRHEGVDARELQAMLVPDDAVEAWAEQAAGDASGAEARARAVQEAIRARVEAGAFQRWSFGVPRETPIAPPARVLDWLKENGARHHLYPIEVAALMTSALRALDVDAMVAEAIRFAGERTPPDPSGQFGYFVVAVYPGGAGEGEPTYFDPYGGRTTAPEESRVLTDLEAIGGALGLKALHLLSRETEPQRGLEIVDQALRLDARSPNLRAVRGAILVASGQIEQGVREFESAKQLRPDAPRRNLMAAIYLASSPMQDLEAASREIAEALEQYPDFAPGRANLAAIHLSRQETGMARQELTEAERIDPDYHLLPQLWASYYVMTGDTDRAIEHAQASIAKNPADIQAHLLAGRIYRQAGRYELMRREAHEVMERTEPARREQMRQIIGQLLGPTALEPIDDGLDDDALGDDLGSLGGDPPGGLKLDSPLLGGRSDGPSLLGGGSGGGPSLLDQQLGGGSGGGGGFQLGGGSGGGLRLNLSE